LRRGVSPIRSDGPHVQQGMAFGGGT
jgi:hypothetical protein